jgi:hypothetical protein
MGSSMAGEMSQIHLHCLVLPKLTSTNIFDPRLGSSRFVDLVKNEYGGSHVCDY